MTTFWAILAVVLVIALAILLLRMRPAAHDVDLRANSRIPLILPVHLRLGDHGLDVVSSDISRGGIRLQVDVKASAGQPVELSLALPGLEQMTLYGVVRWRERESIGILFDLHDPNRPVLLGWMEAHEAQEAERMDA